MTASSIVARSAQISSVVELDPLHDLHLLQQVLVEMRRNRGAECVSDRCVFLRASACPHIGQVAGRRAGIRWSLGGDEAPEYPAVAAIRDAKRRVVALRSHAAH